jgi:hypothetical protein
MRGCAGSSDSRGEDAVRGGGARRPARGGVPVEGALSLTVLLAGMLIASFGAGCAARRPVVASSPPSVPEPSTQTPAQTPTLPSQGLARSGAEKDSFPPLPGTDRVYPSQDPRNQLGPGAPEAFPHGAAIAEPVAAGPDPARLGAASPAPPARWSVQLLASASAEVARERAATLAPYFAEPPRVEPAGGLFKVRVGHCASRDEAEALRRHAVHLGLGDAFVVPMQANGDPPR